MYPKVNQNIMIDINDHDASCRSLVAEVGDEEILICFPMDKSITGLLAIGTKLEITYIVEDNKYSFQTEITGRKKAVMPLFHIRKPKENEIIRIQLRENFRVRTNLRLYLDEYELSTINISAGGALFSCEIDLPYQQGEQVSGTIVLPNLQMKELDSVKFDGVIIRINQMNNDERKYVALQFSSMDQKDQKKLVQYCFEKERQNRLKGR